MTMTTIPVFVRATAGNGMGGIFVVPQGDDMKGGLSVTAFWGLRGLCLCAEDGPAPQSPHGSYAGVSSRELARGTPGFYNVGTEQVPLETMIAAVRRTLAQHERELLSYSDKIGEPEPWRTESPRAWRSAHIVEPFRALLRELEAAQGSAAV